MRFASSETTLAAAAAAAVMRTEFIRKMEHRAVEKQMNIHNQQNDKGTRSLEDYRERERERDGERERDED